MDVRPVLVVDDDAATCSLTADILRSEGYQIATATNGQEALDVLRSSHPFVVVLDLEMPVMDGRSFRLAQRELPADLRSIPVIVCSGSDGVEHLAAEVMPLAWLSKPLLSFEPLLQHVSAARLSLGR